jgi:hypothetical protein
MAVQWNLLDPNMAAKVGGSFQEGQRNALMMQQAGQEQQMNALKMQQDQQEIGNKNALSRAYQASGGDINKLKESLLAGGHFESAMKVQKQITEQQTADLAAKKAELDDHVTKIGLVAQLLSPAHDQPSLDAAIQEAESVAGPEFVQNVPRIYNPTELQFAIKKGLSVKDQAYNASKEMDQELRRQEISALGGYRQEQLGLGERELGLKAQEAKRKANEPVKLENIPPAHRAAYMENEAALNKIDSAIEKIKGNPEALGMGNVAGEFVTQRTDPEGVATRAALAEISSQKRHELSGASITASESPVLAPFIPKATDDPTAAIDKLNSLKKHYLESNSQFESEYAKPDYKSPFPTKATERKEKTQLIDDIKKAQKEGKFSLGAKGEKEMDLEKQPIEDLRKLRDMIKGGGTEQQQGQQETKVIRGKTYYKINGEWHE